MVLTYKIDDLHVEYRADRTNSLCYGKGRPKADELYTKKEDDARLAHPVERLVLGRRSIVLNEIQKFTSDAIASKSFGAHVPTTHMPNVSQTKKLRQS